jgi:hypothetical protein
LISSGVSALTPTQEKILGQIALAALAACICANAQAVCRKWAVSIDILDIADPRRRIPEKYGVSANSVAVRNGLAAVAVEAANRFIPAAASPTA